MCLSDRVSASRMVRALQPRQTASARQLTKERLHPSNSTGSGWSVRQEVPAYWAIWRRLRMEEVEGLEKDEEREREGSNQITLLSKIDTGSPLLFTTDRHHNTEGHAESTQTPGTPSINIK